MDKSFVEEIIKKLSAEKIEYSLDEKKLFDASLDHMRYSAMPDCVVYAKCENEISKTVKIAAEHSCPVTIRGSGTGCAAGCVPFCGGIVLDLSAINFIEIDPSARTAHVGAGAITADIDEAAKKFGLMYAPDPSSHKYSSIGGNIACNAGGLRAAKYGVTRENVLALSAYLASGEKITCGLPIKKFSVGINLRDIIIGSEGTLAIVSEAWLKLVPLPVGNAVALAFFEGDEKGFQAIEKIMRSPLQPAVLEFMDAETVYCVRKREPALDIPENACALLAKFDTADAESDAKIFVKVLGELSGNTARFANGEEETQLLWKVRRAASPAMYELGNSKISQDIVLPFKKVGEFFKFFKNLGKEKHLPTPVFGHAADGNYHIHFMYDGSIAGERGRAVVAMDIAIKKAIELGGAVSGEHGIGALKSKYMPLQHSAAELEIMKKIKEVFDPKDILNRGKIYNITDFSDKSPMTGIKLPWD